MISWCDPDLIPKEEWLMKFADPIMAGAPQHESSCRLSVSAFLARPPAPMPFPSLAGLPRRPAARSDLGGDKNNESALGTTARHHL